VSVLNGHIHQVMQKVEGHVSFHTAMSTAFPQPAPDAAPSPGPMKVEAGRLRKVLGLSRMSFHDVSHPIAITDLPLEDSTKASAGAEHEVVLDNRVADPSVATVPVGATVTWINRGDLPQSIVGTDRQFRSPMLDREQRFSRRFDAAGTYAYTSSLDSTLVGYVVVG
jgi:Icc protein